MGGHDKTAAERQWRGDHRINSEILQADRRTDDIDDGIDRTNLVKMDIGDSNTVNECLGFRQPPENVTCPLFYRIGESAVGNHGINAGVMPVGMVVMHGHVELECGEMVALCAADGQIIGADRQGQFEQFGTEVIKRHTQVKECGYAHIAGDSGKAIEIEYGHGLDSLVISIFNTSVRAVSARYRHRQPWTGNPPASCLPADGGPVPLRCTRPGW